jgi:hypothetical protein
LPEKVERPPQRASFRKFTFADTAKVEELIARTATKLVLADWHSFEKGLQNGIGTVTLAITEQQYRLLLRLLM